MKHEKKVQKYEVSKDYLRIPILYIDVNIEEGKKQRIIIYDNDKAVDLAREFGQKHSNFISILQNYLKTLLADSNCYYNSKWILCLPELSKKPMTNAQLFIDSL